MLNDPLANALSNIQNMENVGKIKCLVKPSSKIIEKVLTIMKKHEYIKDFKIINDGKGSVIEINLTGKINKCGVIKPRYNIKKDGFEKFEKRYLLAKDFGILIISTSEGIMTHSEAKDKHIGGKLLAFVY